MFGVFLIGGLLEGEALKIHFFTVNDNFLIQRRRRHYIFHAAHELESVLVQLLHMADRDRAESILGVVLLQEGLTHVREVAVFVGMLKFHE